MSEVIITAEMKEDAKKCNSRSCMDCKMPEHGTASKCVEVLASLPGVWDEADSNIDRAEIIFILNGKSVNSASYTRTAERLAKIEVLEIAKQMFLDLDEMNPVDYTDSFDVINTLLEELRAGQS